MTALVMRWIGLLAGAIVTLAAHYGAHLDAGTVLVVLTMVLGEVGHLVVKLAARRWPVVGRLVGWLSRAAAAVPSSASSSSLPAGPTADPRPTGGGNVTVVKPGPPAGPSPGTP